MPTIKEYDGTARKLLRRIRQAGDDGKALGRIRQDFQDFEKKLNDRLEELNICRDMLDSLDKKVMAGNGAESRLSGLANLRGELQALSEDLVNPYYHTEKRRGAEETDSIAYDGCFMRCGINQPSDFVRCDQGKTILVSSWSQPSVRKVDTASFKKTSLIDSVRSLGFSLDNAKRPWVCDFYGQRLIQLDRNGNGREEICLSELLVRYREIKYPMRLSITGDQFYLILSSEDRKTKRLVRFSQADPYGSLTMLDFGPVKDICFLDVQDGTLIFSNSSPPLFAAYDLNLDRYLFVTSFYGLNFARAFASCGDTFFVNVDHYIFKLNSAGKVLFRYRLDTKETGPDTAFYAMECFSDKTKNYMIGLDFTNACIHRFVISSYHGEANLQDI